MARRFRYRSKDLHEKVDKTLCTLAIAHLLKQLLFITVFDLGSPIENTKAIRGRIESGEINGPEILTGALPRCLRARFDEFHQIKFHGQ